MGYNDDWEDEDLSKPENPNAFPRPYSYDDSEALHYLAHSGMTLRDYFAGQTLAGIAEHGCSVRSKNPLEQGNNIARLCYAIADAMLAQRSDEPTNTSNRQLLHALGELELSILDLDILDLVDGWGEPKHRPEIGVTLTTNAGQIYRIADALREAGRLVNSDDT